MKFTILLLFSIVFACAAIGQNKKATISGKVVDENDKPLFHVNISILGKDKGTSTNDSGNFTIAVTPGRPLALVFSYTGYKTAQRNFNLAEGENEIVTVQLQAQQWEPPPGILQAQRQGPLELRWEQLLELQWVQQLELQWERHLGQRWVPQRGQRWEPPLGQPWEPHLERQRYKPIYCNLYYSYCMLE